jgi:hypothetical protein
VTVRCGWSEADHADDWSSKQPLSVALGVRNWYPEVIDIDGIYQGSILYMYGSELHI